MENSNDIFLPKTEIQTSDKELKPNQPLYISPEGKSYLITTAKWSTFIAIVGFVMLALMIVSGISILILSPVMDEYQDFQAFQYFPASAWAIGLLYLISAVICFFPYYYLYTFSKKVKLGMINDDQQSLNEGLKNLKKTAKFVGIVTIITLALTLLLIPAAIFSIGMIQALGGGGVVV